MNRSKRTIATCAFVQQRVSQRRSRLVGRRELAEIAIGFLSRPLADTPIAVIDFETTGLSPGVDRAVELAIVRLDHGKAPYLAFDTLINPRRPMAATEIHGITEADVRNAPEFGQVVREVLRALEGCIVASYNIYFDMRFLEFELNASHVNHALPHFCLMYMRPMLGLGSRCRLDEACRLHDVKYSPTHFAADDANAAAQLLKLYIRHAEGRKIRTFQQLAELRSYKFAESFVCDPITNAAAWSPRLIHSPAEAKSRSGYARSAEMSLSQRGFMAYWDELKIAVADMDISDDELDKMLRIRVEHRLTVEHVRHLHARAFSSVLAQFCADHAIDEREAGCLKRLHQCLSKLGWAPGT